MHTYHSGMCNSAPSLAADCPTLKLLQNFSQPSESAEDYNVQTDHRLVAVVLKSNFM